MNSAKPEIERLYKLAIDMSLRTKTTKDEWIEVHRTLASLSLRSYLAADVSADGRGPVPRSGGRAAGSAKEKKRAFEKCPTHSGKE